MYKPDQLQKLEEQGTKLCDELLRSIFGDENLISEEIWKEELKKSYVIESFKKIRNKVFKEAKINNRHKNK